MGTEDEPRKAGEADAAAINREAAALFVAFESSGESPAARAALEAWRAADPRHERAFARLAETLGAAALLRAAPEAAHLRREARATSTARPFARTRRAPAIAAMLGALFLAGAALLALEARGDVHQTGIGERRTVALADGSTLLLNTATRVRVRFSGRARRVALERGEAAFDIAPDPARPFRVAAGDIVIAARGTAFDVRRDGAAVRIILVEGAIDLGPRTGPAPEPFALKPGEAARLDEQGRLAALGAVDVAALGAWREGRVYLSDAPLAAALAEFNRYAERRLVLDDASLGGLRLSGAFEVGDNERLAEALAALYGLAPPRRGRAEIGLARARHDAPQNFSPAP